MADGQLLFLTLNIYHDNYTQDASQVNFWKINYHGTMIWVNFISYYIIVSYDVYSYFVYYTSLIRNDVTNKNGGVSGGTNQCKTKYFILFNSQESNKGDYWTGMTYVDDYQHIALFHVKLHIRKRQSYSVYRFLKQLKLSEIFKPHCNSLKVPITLSQPFLFCDVIADMVHTSYTHFSAKPPFWISWM